jgi:predicted MPP superfamily phosphohydrolase
MPDTSIGWLHWTDLHMGHELGRPFLHNVEEELLADLGRLHRKAGPWDAVLFTGDLTQQGKPEEFQALDQFLGRLWAHLETLGSQPVLIAVPGNHDLVRPPRPLPAAVRALGNWHGDPELQKDFWSNASGEYRQVIDTAFAPYSAWWLHHPRAPQKRRPGLLPGDHAITLEQNGVRLGIVGLNSSFLQLTGDDYSGRLHLDVRQMNAVCGDVPRDWFAEHDAALLLTHHPVAWLHPDARRDYPAEIYKPGRFIAHLFGHMHEAAIQTVRQGGGEARRHYQGTSLFGLEIYGQEQQRVHGYSAGRLHLGQGRAELHLWPRIMRRLRDGSLRLVADLDQGLNEDEAIVESLPLVSPIKSIQSTRPPPPPASRPRMPHPLGAGYNPRFHLHREADEKRALRCLERSGRPVVIQAPHGYGKTNLMEYLLDAVRRAAPAPEEQHLQVSINLHHVPREALTTADAFARHLAHQVADAAILPGPRPGPGPGARAQELVHRAWQTAGTPWGRLGHFVRHQILGDRRRFVLALDGTERLIGCDFAGDFFGLLRAWSVSPDEAWEPLRLLLGLSTLPALLDTTQRSFFAGVAEVLHLGPLDDTGLRKMAEMHELTLDEPSLVRLRDVTGGHPYLARLALYQSRDREVSLGELLQDLMPFGGIFQHHLDQLRLWLEREGLLSALCGLFQTPPRRPSFEAYCQLYAQGLLIEERPGVYRFRCRLYQDFFRDLCQGA